MTNGPGDDQPEDQGQQYGWAPPPQGQWAYQTQDHPRAVLVLVLGILGVVACQVLGPVAWVMGRRVLTEIDQSQGRLGGRSAAQAGWILGIVGTVILGISLAFLAFFLLLAVVGTVSMNG